MTREELGRIGYEAFREKARADNEQHTYLCWESLDPKCKEANILAAEAVQLAIANERNFPRVTHGFLADAGINPFALQLVAESLLKHPEPIPVSFSMGVDRSDIPGFSALNVYLEPVPKPNA